MTTKIGVENAKQVTFAGHKRIIKIRNQPLLEKKHLGVVVCKGDVLKYKVPGGIVELIVINHTPEPGAVRINEGTAIYLQEEDYEMRFKRLKKLYKGIEE